MQRILRNIDYLNVNPLGWTSDAKTDDQINILLHNYNIKYNEELGRLQEREIQYFHW